MKNDSEKLNSSNISGTIPLDLNKCFPNAIKCRDFHSVKLTKDYKIQLSHKNLCKITFDITVSKDYENSIRYRSFYTQCTKDKQRLTSGQQTEMTGKISLKV